MSSDEWILYYWNGEPPFCGRGEFARLMFEEAGVQYTEVNDGKVLYNEIILGKGDGYPMFAPPVIKKGTRNSCSTQLSRKFELLTKY